MIREKSILHIFDDAIICDSTIELFEKLDYNQSYYIITIKPEKYQALIESNPSVKTLNPKEVPIRKILVELINKVDVVFFQGLSVEKAQSLLRSNHGHRTFIWGLWGYALYNIADYTLNLTSTFSTTLKRRKGLVEIMRDYYTFNLVYKRAIKKIDICLFLLKDDYALLGRIVSHKAEWQSACYQTTENIIGSKTDFKVNGQGILIGNSSTPSNRHNLIFNRLKEINIKHRELIVPLNYGDMNYQKDVLIEGKDWFKEQFKPLTEFLPINDFIKIIRTCSHVIMAHERQQAFGTITMMLIGGAKVFLSLRSPLYNWYRNLGIHIFSIEKDLNQEIQQPLSLQFQEENKSILSDYLSEKKTLNKLDAIIQRAFEISNNKQS